MKEMSVRERLNTISGLWVGAGVLAAVGLIFEGYHFFKSPSVPTYDRSKVGTPSVFYTSDEGATLFVGFDNQAMPLDSNGKAGVKAYVYMSNGKQFIQCLEKFSNGPGSSLLVKRPGDEDWVPDSSPAAAGIRQPKSPDGGTPVAVLASN